MTFAKSQNTTFLCDRENETIPKDSIEKEEIPVTEA